MRELLREAAYLEISELLERYAHNIINSTSRVILSSAPTLSGALSIAPLEAALIDSSIQYCRRFTSSPPTSETFVWFSENSISDSEIPTRGNNGIILSPLVVEGLIGHRGDSRKGPLSPVAQSHALAQQISPSSKRLRKMRPWALSGNWNDSALDTAYDPVFSAIRDFLESEGTISVVPLTEVDRIESKNYRWMDIDEYRRIRERWPEMALGEREEAMSGLALPSLLQNTPSTPRLECLLWQCIMGIGWKSDLASQLSWAIDYWKSYEPREAASRVADSLITSGQINSLKP